MIDIEQYHPPEEENKESFEYWLDYKVKDDYFRQIDIFQKVGLLDIISTSYRSYEAGRSFFGIDGQKYSLPEFEQIRLELIRNKEKYEAKFKQGFREIQLTPFGLPLNVLIETLKQRLLTHYKEGRLFATKKKEEDPDKLLKLDVNQPIKARGWEGADISGKCIYYPESFDQENHKGKTKQEILDKQREKQSPFTGWNVILLEDNPNIPRKGESKTIGGRRRLGDRKTPEQYLELLQNDPQYGYEQGLTNEDWLTQFLICLEKEGRVINDMYFNSDDDYWYMSGSLCYSFGSFDPVSRCVGFACWDLNEYKAVLSVTKVDDTWLEHLDYSDFDLRSAVGLEKF